MNAPRVSVVLPSRNGSRHIDEAIRSVAEQTLKDWELVLVDDGSTDDTGERMEAWAVRDPRIRVVHLSPNRGLPAALNEGFRHARAELFTWTSDDNLLLPGALERMAGRLDDALDVDVVYADYVCFGDSGHERRVHVAATRLLPLNNVVGYCFLYRREVHEALGGFDEGLFLAEDYDFWLRASARFQFEAIPEVLYRGRVHPDSLSARHAPDVILAACQALDRALPRWTRPERAHALMRRAQQLFARGRPWHARRLVLRAAATSPSVAFMEPHRRAIALSFLGGLARHLPSHPGQVGHPAVRLINPSVLGGVTTYLLNLAAARPAGGPRTEFHWLDHERSRSSAASAIRPSVDHEGRIAHAWPGENLFAVLRRMRRSMPRGNGIIVASDFFSIAFAARHGRRDHVVQVVHQDTPYYYGLAESFEPFVDVYVTVSARIRDELIRRLPHRAADILHLRSGVPTRGPKRSRHQGPLRLVFSGRLEPVKGVLDLPAIDRCLRTAGTDVVWTIVGEGPLRDALESAFAPEARVGFTGAIPYDAARALLAEHDVLVLPSLAEGLSLALLEAMAAGVVPVASDIASGTREVVEDGTTGLLAEPGRPEAFAAAIVRLARDPNLLERLSAAAAEKVERRHSLAAFGGAFYGLLDDLRRRPIPYRPRFTRGPSRLDRPWLPNAVVRCIRAASRAVRKGAT